MLQWNPFYPHDFYLQTSFNKWTSAEADIMGTAEITGSQGLPKCTTLWEWNNGKNAKILINFF